MSKHLTAPTFEERQLDTLVDHPLQAIYNEDLGDFALKVLAADIKRNGLQDNIQILPTNRAGLPPNTILHGHRRRRALKRNRVTKTIVCVRHDLALVPPRIVETTYLESNADGLFLAPLTMARRALRLFEIQKGRVRKRFTKREEDEARDLVGRVIGVSGRDLNCYFQVLKTPIEVQNALRDDKIALVEASKVADLKPNQQAEIAARIGAGETPKAVLGEFFLAGTDRHSTVNDAFASLVRNLQRGHSDLEGRIDEVSKGKVDFYRSDLERGHAVIAQLLALTATQPLPSVGEIAAMPQTEEIRSFRRRGHPRPIFSDEEE